MHPIKHTHSGFCVRYRLKRRELFVEEHIESCQNDSAFKFMYGVNYDGVLFVCWNRLKNVIEREYISGSLCKWHGDVIRYMVSIMMV